MNVIVDFEVMSAKFESHGLKMALVEDEDVALIITNTGPNRANDRWDLVLSRHFFERLGYEFLSLDWFVEENARRVDFSALTEHEASGLRVVEGDPSDEVREALVSGSSVQQALLRYMESNQDGDS